MYFQSAPGLGEVFKENGSAKRENDTKICEKKQKVVSLRALS